jgi:hypothetical protein
MWVKARVQIVARPDWYFVELHAHGATGRDRGALIGPPAVVFHEALTRRAADDPRFFVHYVTTCEMVTLILAAESGLCGSVDEARDFSLT